MEWGLIGKCSLMKLHVLVTWLTDCSIIQYMLTMIDIQCTLYMYIHVLPVATVVTSLIPPANSSREAPL